MADYTFVGPGGKEVTIQGPDGATPEQQMQALQHYFGAGTPKPPAPPLEPLTADPRENMNFGEKFMVGAGAATDRAARGIAGLIPDRFAPTAVKNYLKRGKEDTQVYEDNHPGGWATAGEIGADVAMSAIPVAKGAQLAQKGLSVLPKAAARFAPAAADVGANAAWSAATAPENRGTAAAIGGGGATAGRVLNRSVSGLVKPSAAGQEMMDRGVKLTPGQAGEGVMGSAARVYEHVLEGLPLSSYLMRGAKDKARRSWSDEVVSRVHTPEVTPEDKVLKKSLAELRKSLNSQLSKDAVKATNKRGPKVVPPTPTAASARSPQQIIDDAVKEGDTALEQEARAAQQVLGDPKRAVRYDPSTYIRTAIALGTGKATGHASTAALLTSLLGTTETGRKFILGQVPWQKVVAEHPDVAAKVTRAIAMQGQPQPAAEEEEQ